MKIPEERIQQIRSEVLAKLKASLDLYPESAPKSEYLATVALSFVASDLRQYDYSPAPDPIPEPDPVSVPGPPAPPAVTVIAGDKQLLLRITQAPGTDHYKIFFQRSPQEAFFSTLSDSFMGGEFRHQGLTNGQLYKYRVIAVDSLGQESITPARVSGIPVGSIVTPSPFPPPVFAQSDIDRAMGYKMLRGFYGYDGTRDWPDAISLPSGYASGQRTDIVAYFVALVACLNPVAKASSGALLQDRVVDQIHEMLSGGPEKGSKDVYFHGIQGAQMGVCAGAILCLAKHTPAIWNRISSDDKARADFYMRMLSVVGTLLGNNIENDLDGNIKMQNNANSNPNQRCFMRAMFLAAVYFSSSPGVDDGAINVNSWLMAFNFDAFLSQLKAFSWDNNLRFYSGQFSPRIKEFLTQGGITSIGRIGLMGVRQPFRVRGLHTLKQGSSSNPNPTLDHPGWGDADPPWLEYTAENCFGREEIDFGINCNVVSRQFQPSAGGGCDGQHGRLADGSTFPLEGKLGFPLELNLGARSSVVYVAGGLEMLIICYSLFVALGYWRDNEKYARWKNMIHNAMSCVDFINAGHLWIDTEYACSARDCLKSVRTGDGFILSIWRTMFRGSI